MAVKVVEVFEVVESYDRSSNHVCFITSGAEAQKIIEGNPYASFQPRTFIFIDTADDLKEHKRQRLIQGALAKLSSAEREALGITITPITY